MAYIEVPIVGSGARDDPYRVSLGVPKSALIPTGEDGKPVHTTAFVWVDDKHDGEVDRRIPRIPPQAAHALIKQQDPKADIDAMEQKRARESARVR